MRKLCITFALLTVSSMVHAAENVDSTSSPEEFKPTQGMISMKNMVDTGALIPMLTDEYYGLHQASIGESRNNTMYARAQPAFVVLPKFKDNDRAKVGAFSLMHELPSYDGANFIRATILRTNADGDNSSPLENDGHVSRTVVQFLHVPNPQRVYGFGLTYDNSHFNNYDNIDSPPSNAKTSYRGYGLQLLFAQDFSGPLAAFIRLDLQRGKTDFEINQYITPLFSIPINYNGQRDDRLYIESQLVGTWNSANAGWIPHGWALHPAVGATFQRNFVGSITTNIGTTVEGVDGATEDFGLAFAKVVFQKDATFSPNFQVTPRFTLGLEHQYVNDVDENLKDRTMLVTGVGVGFSKFGQRLDIDYIAKNGQEDRRDNKTLLVALSVAF